MVDGYAVATGMDPHKQSAVIEVMDSNEAVLGGGLHGTDLSGCQADAPGSAALARAGLSRAAPAPRRTATAVKRPFA